ncbi:MAG: pyruvate kinase [Saprospiraceae bacterium]|nr:pyruvate kinase [Saprospiraceae bacterium]
MTLTEAAALLQKNKSGLRKDGSQFTKIVATVGPACSAPDKLLDLVQAGVDVFRLNFSHGSHEDHLQVIQRIQAINREHNLHIGILADLQGPKLRVGKIKDNALPLAEGDIITITNDENAPGVMDNIYMSYDQFAEDCEVGERILMDDGKLIFEVVETNKKDTVRLKALHAGVLSSNKGVNLPDTNVKLPALTEKDEEDLNFILTQDVNWIALSFVRRAEDLQPVKDALERTGHQAKVMAKIEKPEAVRNLREIIRACNGIMVARGDLGVEMPIEKLAMTQKDIIHMCMQYARPVIVATQMMDSMINNPSPTRAEVTDVANAVLDGADAVMLSGETSVGKYPKLVIQYMSKIITEAEKQYWPQISNRRPSPSPQFMLYHSDVIIFSACNVAEEIGAKGIVGHTVSGYTAFKLSSFRPKSNIFIFSDQLVKLGAFNLLWGVQCFYYNRFTTTDETIQDCVDILKESGYVKSGDTIINTGSMPMGARKPTNMMKLTDVE